MKLMIIGLLIAQAATAATISIDGSRTNQVIEGFGVNANHRSWNGTELVPVLDALISQAGMTLFRVVFDEADWEATNDNTDPGAMDWSYYDAVYGSNTLTLSASGQNRPTESGREQLKPTYCSPR